MSEKRVVIVGAGFGGLAAAKALCRARIQTCVIDKRNYHLFQPLLYQVATAALSPAQIAQPVRSILRRWECCTVALADVVGIDTKNRKVLSAGSEVGYDYLILATGVADAYFGHDEWAAFAPGLKSIEDATAIRKRILSAFERAEVATDDSEKQALMTFVIVGGGPTGVEMAGAIAELARISLKNDFRHIDPRKTRVILAEAGPHILRTFPEKLSTRAKRDMEALGVEVLTGNPVMACTGEYVIIKGEKIATHTVLWAAGIKASPAAEWLNAKKDKLGRVIVNPDLSVPDHPEIFVIGDTASIQDSDGTSVPGLAPAAIQAGNYVASVIINREQGRAAPGIFTYKDKGVIASIGRGKAVAKLPGFQFSGFFAWVLWSLVHLMSLVGFRNRLIVAADWLWSYFTKTRGVRLITVSGLATDADANTTSTKKNP